VVDRLGPCYGFTVQGPGQDAIEDRFEDDEALSPSELMAWQALSPGERLARAWALRARLPDPQEAHDRKLFPAPR
jgi:hypothetical protein